MKVLTPLLCAIVGLGAVATNADAQTNNNVFTAIGSSALFLEVGQASVTRATTVAKTLPGGSYNVCTFSTKDSNSNGLAYRIYSNDQAPAITNTGSFFAVWTQTPSCGTDPAPSDTVDIWSYLQVDSAVGNRCVFRTGTTAQQCLLIVPPQQISGTPTVTGTQGAGLITPTNTDTAALPSDVINALNSAQFGVAGSDTRPEDAQFAIYRANQLTTTALGTAPGAIYYGMGLSSSNPVTNCATIAVTGSSYDTATPGSVAAAGFALPGGTDPCSGAASVNVMKVTTVGSTPVIVAVNPSGTNNSFASAVDVPRNVIAGFLDGELCRTGDAVPSLYSAGSTPAITFIREPFSGTYNTMEYSIPAIRGHQGSQETGASVSQPTSWSTCNGKAGSRQRITSTGNMVAAIQNTPFSLGYFFWSVGNAKAFTTANGRYLAVDGVDPLLNTNEGGCIPTAAQTNPNCQLNKVTFAHIKDGTYPIYGTQRFVTTCATGTNCVPTQQAEAAAISTAAQNAVATQPDFAPAKLLHTVHSHFLPPIPASANLQGNITVSNGDCAGSVEGGGDVGGAVYTIHADGDYCADFGVTTGIINIVGDGTTTNGNPGQRN